MSLLVVGCRRPLADSEEAPPVESPREKAPVVEAYVPEPHLEGVVRSVGSDSMEPLLMLWALDFKSKHPKVTTEFKCKGSGTAPKALVAGEALMGQMSREMNEAELTAFRAKFGYDPTRVVVAADALAIYVNANNPIQQLTLPQVDAMFGKLRKGGHPTAVSTWGDVGLVGEWQGREVHPYGRDENSGTRAFFKEHVLKKGDYKDDVKAVSDQFGVLEALVTDASGIGYGPIQHRIGQVRQVPIVDFGGTEAIPPTPANILAGRYPLYRFLYIYVNKAPGKELDPTVKAFLTYALSKEGQAGVASFGALPLPADLVKLNAAKIK